MPKIIIPDKILGRSVEGAIERALANPDHSTPTSSPTTNFSASNVEYNWLEGDFGRQVLEEYNQLVQNEYQNASALQKLSFADDVVKGSNSFVFAVLNKVLRKQGKWVARPVDLEKCLKEGTLDLNGTYGDSGLVLRGENDPNLYLAQNLATQIQTKGYSVGEDPIVIPLAGLDLVYDSSSPHNLAFQLTDSSEIIYAPQLNKSNHGKKFNHRDDNGLPVFEEGGSRTLYSNAEGGLIRLYRYWDLGLNARNDDLAVSGVNGRVVFCAEGIAP